MEAAREKRVNHAAHEEAMQSLSVPATAASAPVVRQLVRGVTLRSGAPQDWSDELVLAVSEAFSNAVCHGSGTEADTIHVTVQADGEGIFVELDYLGEPFDTRVRDLPGDVFQHRGRGRFLMRQLLDGEEYLFSEGRTILRMFKHV